MLCRLRVNKNYWDINLIWWNRLNPSDILRNTVEIGGCLAFLPGYSPVFRFPTLRVLSPDYV